ncbi:MAG: hypothetical protein MJY78_07160 [Fibrobacter sp.]|nr:hypothetical protein [Fibrobacter sp.]
MEKLPCVNPWEKDWQRKKDLELFKVLRDYGGYNGLSWMLTSGIANRMLNYHIQFKHSTYPKHFARGGKFSNRHDIPLDSAKYIANNFIGGNDSALSYSFNSKDFYADIDARNIAHLIKRGRSPYEAMNDYYRNQKFGRFNLFVHSYGSWKNFVDKVNSHYFFPITPSVNPIFVNMVKSAFIQRIQKELLHEMGLD